MLAVPITAQVPAVVARFSSMRSISADVTPPARYLAQNRRQSRAGAEAFAAVGHRHHRAGQELHRRHVGRRRAHELGRHRLVAAADQHDGVHRLRADHLLDVDAP